MGEWLNTAVREIYELPVMTRAQLSPNATFLVFDPVAGGMSQINKSELKYGLGVVEYTSAVAASHTGNTNETTLATVTIPGGLLQASSVIEIQALWKIAGGLDEGVLRLYFGDTRYLDYGYPAATALTNTTIYCNNSITAQKGMPAGAGGIAELGSPPLTSAVNTANPVDVTFKGRVLNAGDSVTLEGCRIKLNGV